MIEPWIYLGRPLKVTPGPGKYPDFYLYIITIIWYHRIIIRLADGSQEDYMTVEEWNDKVQKWLESHPDERIRREIFMSGYSRWEQRMLLLLEYERESLFLTKNIQVHLTAQ